MILLDTCVLLWLASAPNELSRAARAVIRTSGEFAFISAITAWEVAWKNATGNLTWD